MNGSESLNWRKTNEWRIAFSLEKAKCPATYYNTYTSPFGSYIFLSLEPESREASLQRIIDVSILQLANF